MTVSPAPLTKETIEAHDQFLTKRFHRIIEFGNIVFSSSLPEGTFKIGSNESANEFPVHGSPSCPEFLASVERLGKHVKVTLADDLAAHSPSQQQHHDLTLMTWMKQCATLMRCRFG